MLLSLFLLQDLIIPNLLMRNIISLKGTSGNVIACSTICNLAFLVAHKGTRVMKNPARSISPDINGSLVNMLLGAAAAFSSSFDSCARMYVYQLPLLLIGTGYSQYQASLLTMLRRCWMSKN
jgi:hypothetical protein